MTSGPLAGSLAARSLGCCGCHDDWNAHALVERATKPMRCRGCPVHTLMLAAGIEPDPRRVAPEGTGKCRMPTEAFRRAMARLGARRAGE